MIPSRLLLLTSLLCSLSLSANSALRVSSLSHKPNYKYSSATKDNLTDGAFSTRYLWINRKSAVWQNISPVQIDIDVTDTSLLGKAGKLSIHSASAPKAGLYPPRFIDIYKKHEGDYIPLTSKLFQFKKNLNKHNLWLDIYIKNIPEKISIIVHANKQFLAIDEIKLASHKQADKPNKQRSDAINIAHNSIIANSADNLKEALRQNNNKKGNANIILKYKGNITTLKPCASNCKHSIELSGYSGEEESLHITTPENGCRVLLESTPGASAYRLMPVQSFDGEVVNDITKQIKSGWHEFHNSVEIKITLDLSEQTPQHNPNLIVFDCGKTFKHTVIIDSTITSMDLDKEKPEVNVWAYPSHFNKKLSTHKIYSDLRRRGVSFVTIHPHNIPIRHEQHAVTKRFKRIISQVPRDFKVLLYLNLKDIEENTVTLHNNKTELKNWLTLITNLMADASRTTEDWILYPIDEVRSSQIPILYNFSKQVKEITSKVKIYANPINDSKERIGIWELKKLKYVIDYWQPSIELASKQHTFFKQSDNYMVYSNPSYPSKSESPDFFRKLPIKAICLGASGVGFWAYNENDGTSPYNDFDGSRADWSVVYMDDNELKSSARWDSFKDGTEDYKLLSYGLRNLTNIQHDFSTLCNNLDTSNWLSDLYKLRDKILSQTTQQ